MDMVMNQEVRTPGVQDGEESDLRTEMIGIAGHLEQGLGAGIEEQIEEGPGRSQPQRVQLVGQREDDMEVVGVDQIALLKLEPSPACLRLAFRAAPGSAGVVGHGCFVRTALTLIPVPAESSSPDREWNSGRQDRSATRRYRHRGGAPRAHRGRVRHEASHWGQRRRLAPRR